MADLILIPSLLFSRVPSPQYLGSFQYDSVPFTKPEGEVHAHKHIDTHTHTNTSPLFYPNLKKETIPIFAITPFSAINLRQPAIISLDIYKEGGLYCRDVREEEEIGKTFLLLCTLKDLLVLISNRSSCSN
jgi:hypothetical protein